MCAGWAAVLLTAVLALRSALVSAGVGLVPVGAAVGMLARAKTHRRTVPIIRQAVEVWLRRFTRSQAGFVCSVLGSPSGFC